MTAYIAVDIGGTQMRAACYRSDDLSPIDLKIIPTRATGETVLERLISLIKSVFPSLEKLSAIGVAAPGPLNPYQGVIFKAPNIPEWIDLPLASLLEGEFGVPVLLGNDANMAALGEWQFGVARGHHHLIYITISTGIGAGVITNDRLLLGFLGLAGELGHITVLPDGPLCACGQRGHLEAVASGPAIAHWVEQELSNGVPSILSTHPKPTAKDIFAAAQSGDMLAIAAFDRAGTFLGYAIADFLQMYNPSIVIIGGGVSKSGELLMHPLRTSLQDHVFSPRYLENLTITNPALGEEAGLMGALALARNADLHPPYHKENALPI